MAGPVLQPAASEDTHGARGLSQGLRGSLRHALRSPGVRGSLGALVLEPASGKVLLRHQAGARSAPASTAKLTTAVAALSTLGPYTRLTTRVVRKGGSHSITLVGGGDPTLAGPKAHDAYPEPASLASLARKTARSLGQAGMEAVTLRYDTSLFRGPRTASTWKSGYVSHGYVAPITALMVDEGRVHPGKHVAAREPHPPRAAAKAFAGLLEDRGVTVRGGPRKRPVTGDAQKIAAVRSPPLAALVERMLTTSDNTLAESLGRQVALAAGKPPTFKGATTAVIGALDKLGVPTRGIRLDDCSGLSHRDRVTARALARLLALAAQEDHPKLRPVLTGLPVAGYSGTLGERFTDESTQRAAGLVRAKTGTLNGVSTLAGVAYRPDGRMLVFAFLAGNVPMGGYASAREALDDLASTLVTVGSSHG